MIENEKQPYYRERKNRINLLVWAYAYEIKNDPVVDDSLFDKISEQIDVNIETDRPDLDKWFRNHFDKSTGQWIHNFPDKNRLESIYNSIKRSYNKNNNNTKKERKQINEYF